MRQGPHQSPVCLCSPGEKAGGNTLDGSLPQVSQDRSNPVILFWGKTGGGETGSTCWVPPASVLCAVHVWSQSYGLVLLRLILQSCLEKVTQLRGLGLDEPQTCRSLKPPQKTFPPILFVPCPYLVLSEPMWYPKGP